MVPRRPSVPRIVLISFAPLVLLALAALPTSAETFFLKGGEAVVGEVTAADEGGIELRLVDETVIAIPGGDLQPLSFYRALRSTRDLSKPEDRIYLGDRCLALGLPDLALSEYKEAHNGKALGSDLSRALEGKRSLARSVLAYSLYEESVKQFDAGSFLSARSSFRKFVEQYGDLEHLVEAARDYLQECDVELFPSEEKTAPEVSRAQKARLDAIDRKMNRVDDLIEESRQAIRKALLSDNISSRARQALLRGADRAKRALESSRGLTRDAADLPAHIVAEADRVVQRSTTALIDAYLKLAHLHLLASDFGRAKAFVDKILALDAKYAAARSLLRLIQARAKEATPEEGPIEVVRRYRKRAAILNGFRGGRGPNLPAGQRTSSGSGPRAPSAPRSPAPQPRGRNPR